MHTYIHTNIHVYIHTQVGPEYISTEEFLAFVESHLKKALEAPQVHDAQGEMDVGAMVGVSEVSAWHGHACMHACVCIYM
jgi:hypothetical protein